MNINECSLLKSVNIDWLVKLNNIDWWLITIELLWIKPVYAAMAQEVHPSFLAGQMEVAPKSTPQLWFNNG